MKKDTDTTDSEEIAYFDNLGGEWWKPKGAFAALRRMTPARVEYITLSAARLLGIDDAAEESLKGLRILDIGCGGGILSEPLARLGAKVTGIDASGEAIGAAKEHAAASGLEIEYHALSLEDFAARNKPGFDIVIASEVIEHVPHRPAFLSLMAGFAHKRKPSIAILTTINRSLAGVLLGKYAAEYILHLAPKGAHEPGKLVRPSELRDEARAAGIAIDDITGINISVFDGFALGGPPFINYAASGVINRG